MTSTCNSLIPFFTSTQVQRGGASLRTDTGTVADSVAEVGLDYTPLGWCTDGYSLVEVEEELYAMPGGLLEHVQRPCGASFSAEWAFGLGPWSRISTSKHAQATSLGDESRGEAAGSLAKSRWSPAAEGRQTEEQSATRSTPGTRHQKNGRSYIQKRRSDSQARSTFCVR